MASIKKNAYIILWSLVYLNSVYIYIYIYIYILTKLLTYCLHSSLAWHSLVISLWLHGHTRCAATTERNSYLSEYDVFLLTSGCVPARKVFC